MYSVLAGYIAINVTHNNYIITKFTNQSQLVDNNQPDSRLFWSARAKSLSSASRTDCPRTSSSLWLDRRAHSGSSLSDRNGVSVPVVPILRTFFFRSIEHCEKCAISFNRTIQQSAVLLFSCLYSSSSFYLVRQLHNYKLKQSKATGFGLFVPRPSSGSLPGLRKGQVLEPFFLQFVNAYHIL
jgi:hypothetical protein